MTVPVIVGHLLDKADYRTADRYGDRGQPSFVGLMLRDRKLPKGDNTPEATK
jgi:hypothetical protein